MVLAAIVLLASSLDDLRFRPAGPLPFAFDLPRFSAWPSLSIIQDTPAWKILVFWLVLVINLVLFFLVLPPELRKRIIRQLISFALGILMFVLALRYRVLNWPETSAQPLAREQPGVMVPAAGADLEPFRPPQVTSWMTYLISVVVLWVVLLAGYFLYTSWERYRTRRLTTLDSLAEIARNSLAELGAGRQWDDVVLEAYARMNDVVRVTRGFQRESSSTPREFAARLARMGLPGASVEELTHLFELVRYGGQAPDGSTGRRAAACLESIRRACGMPA